MPGNELETHQEVSSNNKFDLHQHFGCRLSMTSSNLLGVWCSTRPKNCLPTNGMFQVCSICLLIIRYRRNPKFENNMYNCITCIIHVKQLKYIKIKDTMYYMYYIYFFFRMFPFFSRTARLWDAPGPGDTYLQGEIVDPPKKLGRCGYSIHLYPKI